MIFPQIRVKVKSLNLRYEPWLSVTMRESSRLPSPPLNQPRCQELTLKCHPKGQRVRGAAVSDEPATRLGSRVAWRSEPPGGVLCGNVGEDQKVFVATVHKPGAPSTGLFDVAGLCRRQPLRRGVTVIAG